MKPLLCASLLLIAVGGFLTVPTLGGQAPSPNPPATPPAAEDGQLDIQAPITESDKSGDIIFRGGKKRQVVIREVGKDFQIAADLVVSKAHKQMGADGKEEVNRTADITGNLKFTNSDTTVTSTRVFVDFGESKAVFSGEVVIVSRASDPKPEGKSSDGKAPASKSEPAKAKAVNLESKASSPDTQPAKEAPPAKPRKPTTVRCEQFEFNYETRQGVATGKLNIKQEERKATAERALIDDGKNIITLEDKVEMEEMRDGKPRIMKCARIVIETDNETWRAEDEDTVKINLTYTRKKPDPGKGKADGKANVKAGESKAPNGKAGESKAPEGKSPEGKAGS